MKDLLIVLCDDVLDLGRFVPINELQDRIGLIARQNREDICGLSRAHVVDQQRRALFFYRVYQLPLYPRFDLFERIGRVLGLERVEQRNTLAALKFLKDVGKIYGMDLAELRLRNLELDVSGEAAQLRGERLHIEPGDTILFVAIRQQLGELVKSQTAQRPVAAKVDLGSVQLTVLDGELDVVDHLDLVVIHVENLLVEYVVVEQDQSLLRCLLKLRHRLPADVEHDFVVGDEQYFFPRYC